ncbi:MAG TPA: LuxR C-terminal-related transcriptional regulator, partial [Longimicrobiales bacterium]|nr:LuxR C-terminal-related transcriptional regulator [Longimicrobiales bacterium]
WTRGNPYFVEETLKALVDAGRLRQDDGDWRGWELDQLELPRSVRDAIELRLGALDAGAREVAELIAVIGTRASYATIRSVSKLSDALLVDAIEQLRLHNVLTEEGSAREPVYDFSHPMLRQALHAQAGLARRRLLHAAIAETLEDEYGAHALEHADELAHHFMRGDTLELSTRAAKYLAAAGRSALARFANREAADYLEAALERMNAAEDTAEDIARRERVVEDLARARQRLGDFDRAIELRRELCAAAEARGDFAALGTALRRIAVAHFRAGRHREAIAAFDDAMVAAERARDHALAAQVRLGRGAVLQGIGRVQESGDDLRTALDAAERAHDAPLQARAHRELLLFHTMAGPPERARHHGARAIALAEESGDRYVACTCHWAMSVLGGLTGHEEECARHMQRATELAEELNSPLLRLAIDEVRVEWAYGMGAWDTGLALGERAIALARSLRQRQMLPRLLVWTAMIYLGRYQLDRAKAYVDEAWELSGAGDPDRALDVNMVVPAHIGRAHYHMTLWEWDEAIRWGRAGVAIVDAAGYQPWAVHRLLPIIAEAQLSKFDAEAARATGARLRREAEALEHTLGLAWADAADAILTWVDGDPAAAVPRMREAIDRLEAVPYVPSAARLRRQLAGRLAQLGDRDAAISELRRAHDLFVKLGARWELEKTRIQFQEVGARPPGRGAGQGTEALTDRELEIVRLVAGRKSNKAIGKALDISPRTVSTHLSNVYAKLEIGTRAELARMAPTILSAG